MTACPVCDRPYKHHHVRLEDEMNDCTMNRKNDTERDNPSNREIALMWTLHESLMKCNQFAHIPGETRGQSVRYGLEIMKRLIDAYLAP